MGKNGSQGKKAVGLVEDLRLCVSQRRSDPELRDLSAAEAEIGMRLRWDSVPLSKTILSLLVSTLELQQQIFSPPLMLVDQRSSRDQPPIAEAAASHILSSSTSQPAGTDGAGSSSIPADAGSSRAGLPVGNGADKIPIDAVIPHADDAEDVEDADDVNDADDDAALLLPLLLFLLAAMQPPTSSSASACGKN
eukprot:6188135-Pleurochrysis_carterae.AAC.1